ncbi:MAG: hypothetical protein D6797_00420 [Bdellovibrio sp.]|nr:MAG: hypothetical protein D6797_00420 [Bdellovibrio sp.]
MTTEDKELKRWTKKNVIHFVQSLLVFGFVLGAGYWISKYRLKSKSVSHREPLSVISHQIKEKRNLLLKGELGQAYLKRDWQFILGKLTHTNVREQRKFLKDSIHLFDGPLKNKLSSKEKQYLYGRVLHYIQKNHSKFRGKLARSLTLMVRLLDRLGPPPLKSKERALTVNLFKHLSDSSEIKWLLGETISGWRSVPKEFNQWILKSLRSHDLSIVNRALYVSTSILDPRSKLLIVQFLDKNYETLSDAVKPKVLKVLIQNRKLLKKDIANLVQEAFQNKGFAWEDVLVFALENNVQSDPDFIKSVYHRVTHPLLKKRLSLLMQKTRVRN